MRILLAWELGGGLGHLSRLAPVARELERRGHEVIAAVRDPARAAEWLPGIRVLPAPARELPPEAPLLRAGSFADILHNVGWHSGATLEQLVSAWLGLLDEVRPGLLVLDFAPSALLAARLRDMPRVLLSTGFSSPPDVAPFPSLLHPPEPERELECARRESLIQERANQILSRSGRRPLARLGQLYSEVERNIFATWPELDHYGTRAGVKYSGVWSLKSGERPPWPPGRGPKVFVYVKNFPARAELFRILGSSGLPVLAYSDSPGPAERADLLEGASVRVVDQPVDLAWAAKQCAFAVLNGGHGASALMLLEGRPILEIPLVQEQHLLSRRVALLGAGQVASPDSPQQIGRALQWLLLDSAPHRAAARFRTRHAGTDQPTRVRRVADAIEESAAAGRAS